MSANTEVKLPGIKLKKTTARHWYALYTKPRFEKKVNLKLEEKGIESYLPLIKTLKQWSDRKKLVIEPAFKSYVFVNVAEYEQSSVLSVNGAVKFVSFGRVSATIPAKMIESLRTIFSQDEFELTIDNQLHQGDLVEVVSGALAGTQGILLKRMNTRYFTVNIETLGKSIMVNIPDNYMRKIN